MKASFTISMIVLKSMAPPHFQGWIEPPTCNDNATTLLYQTPMLASIFYEKERQHLTLSARNFILNIDYIAKFCASQRFYQKE